MKTPILQKACLGLLILTACRGTSVREEPVAAHLRPTDGMEQAWIPGGFFWMGSSQNQLAAALEQCSRYWESCDPIQVEDEGPRHLVYLVGFWMDRTEITNQQYQLCVQAGSCSRPRCWEGSQFNSLEQPAVCVTWDQAGAYCSWAGGRLPTEAEWEYAARGSAGALYPWGNDFDGTRLNYCDATCGRPRSDPDFSDGWYYSAPVGSYPAGASWAGVLDLAGNVSEWVQDGFASYPPHPAWNPIGKGSGGTRVIRGGSWFMSPLEARGAWRQGLAAGDWYDDLGFRCVMNGSP